MTPKQLWITVAVSATTALIAGTFYFVNKSRQSYEVVLTKEGPIKEAIYGLGTVASQHKFSFKVGVTKTIESIAVYEGDLVKKGDLLLKFTDGVVLKSPLEGTVLDLPYNAGENVFPDRAVISIENLRSLYVEARIDQEGTIRVKADLPVVLSFENLRSRTFTGTVHSIYPSQGEFVARIHSENLPAEILPGMTADVAIEVAHKDKALLIPVRAVNSGYALVQRNLGKEKVKVEIGLSDDEWAEVISGDLQTGEKVLIKR
ncbi:MAG: efflux RND transporter periplasmic adaptor subunit [Bdellovibrio sp.]|nr:efflux RND transporter periplasmic adaptor subunit [Bdellovibrio sp.]